MDYEHELRRIAGLLHKVINELHPVHPNTAIRGGAGGQAMTQFCAILYPDTHTQALLDEADEVIRRYAFGQE